MRMLAAVALFSGLLVAGTASYADDAAAPAAPKKKQHKICRDVERSGSHIPKTTCKTKDEWAAFETGGADADGVQPGSRSFDGAGKGVQ